MRLIMEFSLQLGEVMLENGAETSRVEDTMTRVLTISGEAAADVFVTPTGIFASIHRKERDTVTLIRRIRRRGINLHRIAEANQLSRLYCDGKIPVEEGIERIQEVKNSKEYSFWLKVISTGLAAGFFALVFDGGYEDLFVCLITGLPLGLLIHTLMNQGVSRFLIDIVGGMMVASIAYLGYYWIGIGSSFEVIVVSSIMPMVPGVAITNAIRDTLYGDLLSGAARILDAFIIASSIATGVGLALSVLL